MRIKIEFEGEVYYRDCSQAFRWTGSSKIAPDWLTDMLADGDAMIVQGRMGTRDILFKTANGYPHADVGDIIIKVGNQIDIIRKTVLERGYSDG